MDKKILKIIVCPICKNKLSYERKNKELICTIDLLAYPVRDDIPILLINKTRPLF